MIVSLGTDPGAVNFAYSYTKCRMRNGKFRVSILSAGMLHWTITNLTTQAQKPKKSRIKKKIPIAEQMIPPYKYQMRRFTSDWKRELKVYKPQRYTAERFQARGVAGGALGEYISIMNGILSYIALRNKIEFEFITAAGWKNWVNRFITLDDLYKELRKDIPAHIIDATFISVHGGLKHFDMPWTKEVVEETVSRLRGLVYSND